MPAIKRVFPFGKIGNTAARVGFLSKEGDVFTNLIFAFESKREGANADANELSGN
jgi:hypothetical protein